MKGNTLSSTIYKTKTQKYKVQSALFLGKHFKLHCTIAGRFDDQNQ